MLGFQALAPAGSAVRVSGELEDARWFTRAQLTSGEALAPPSHSISWRLISGWLAAGG
jgi:NADH pyrophosphatase NudC (nudix superfamily)